MEKSKVKMDYSFYAGEDLYSDGDEVEQKMLDITKNNEDYESIVAKTKDFPIYYHLTKEREVICTVMDIAKTDEVLEIGSGCGALTGALASLAKSVECIELSKRRSLINANKNSMYENIEIHVGNFEDIKLKKTYDVVTMIGVLEYAGYYIHSKNPFLQFLIDGMERLKPGGRLYIAIENRLGAKYFSGCKEDHCGKVGVGLEGYNIESKIRTFSYNELVAMFQQCGINDYRFFYPYPDYKFPVKIFSEDYLPCSYDFTESCSDYEEKRNMSFDENNFFGSLLINEEFKIFSNSYLVEIRKEK
jgi:2-polyprenyl-3-methyl-5-hydroxy-6-metoxy-1,4-benzoquinol methylase